MATNAALIPWCRALYPDGTLVALRGLRAPASPRRRPRFSLGNLSATEQVPR